MANAVAVQRLGWDLGSWSANRPTTPHQGATRPVSSLARLTSIQHARRLIVGLLFAASSLLIAQPTAAQETYTIEVDFQSVKFANVDDGCAGAFCSGTDHTMEVFGTLTARTSATDGGVFNYLYRNFGTWGSDPWSCPVQPVAWDSSTNGPCLKEITETSSSLSSSQAHAFNNVLLCRGAAKNSCATGYAKNDGAVVLLVHPGEIISVNVAMQDYDKFSPNDTVCTGGTAFGPFDSYALAHLSTPGGIHMADNGDAECQVSLYVRRVA